jgi:esterase/lipase superfamily enzyme
LKRDYLHWVSSNLGRPMELLWFGHSGRPVVTFPTSMGRFYQYEDFGIVRALAPRIEAGELQVCCLDSVDGESWYNRSAAPADRVRRHDQYDRYVREEIFPFVAERAGRADLALFGASFGAYHAVNMACRYPEQVRRSIAFSGLFDIHGYLDSYWDDLCYLHCPTAYVANMDGSWIDRLSSVELVVATGEFDHLAPRNRDFIGLLSGKGIPVRGEIWPGIFGHDWPFWADHLPRFLP